MFGGSWNVDSFAMNTPRTPSTGGLFREHEQSTRYGYSYESIGSLRYHWTEFQTGTIATGDWYGRNNAGPGLNTAYIVPAAWTDGSLSSRD